MSLQKSMWEAMGRARHPWSTSPWAHARPAVSFAFLCFHQPLPLGLKNPACFILARPMAAAGAREFASPSLMKVVMGISAS